MTAIRVIDDHRELRGIGQLSHPQIDAYLLTSPWLVVSGASGPVPPTARVLQSGPGISITDTGPGGALVISVSGSIGTQTKFMDRPVGVNDGINMSFSLSFSPSPQDALMFFVNGVLQEQGVSSDYVLSGSLITVLYNYRSGSNLRATYPY